MGEPESPSSPMDVSPPELRELLANPDTPVTAVLAHSDFVNTFEYQSPELLS